ncbi:MAG: helix-turn-helix domain-containing protein [Janthinobacterium lividum]
MTTLVRQFGLKIRQLRDARGWSQEELAARAELNRSYVGEIERGAAIASIVTAEKLAHALELPVGQLLSPFPGSETTPAAPPAAPRNLGSGIDLPDSAL